MYFPYAVVASDLDGTLLSPNSTVTARTRETLCRLSQAGVYLVLATGRPHCDVVSIMYNMRLPRPGFLVTSGGARVHMIGTTKEEENGTTTTTTTTTAVTTTANAASKPSMDLVLERDVDPDVVCALLQLLPSDEEEINIHLYQGDGWKCSLDWSDELDYFKDSGIRYTVIKPEELVREYQEYLQHQKKEGEGSGSAFSKVDSYNNPLAGVGKVAFGSDNVERLQELAEDILHKWPTKVEAVFSSLHCLDICGVGVTKLSAIEALLQHLSEHGGVSLTMANCIAFGDNLNDKEMLAAAAKGCVMGNANPKLKALLPHLEVIGTNSEDGVAVKLEEVFKLV